MADSINLEGTSNPITLIGELNDFIRNCHENRAQIQLSQFFNKQKADFGIEMD